jgi:hypothetical protein
MDKGGKILGKSSLHKLNTGWLSYPDGENLRILSHPYENN